MKFIKYVVAGAHVHSLLFADTHCSACNMYVCVHCWNQHYPFIGEGSATMPADAIAPVQLFNTDD
jgi:hypothetical protein